MSTCMASSDNFSYMMLNLVGEVGEFASKVAKSIRKEKCRINNNDYEATISETAEYSESGFKGLQATIKAQIAEDLELQKEAGDILWQLAGLCKVMGWNLKI